jgi:hypothetical protein
MLGLESFPPVTPPSPRFPEPMTASRKIRVIEPCEGCCA